MDLIVREFEKHAVRMINENGEAYFVAVDVYNVLGIKQASRAVESLDADEVKKTHVIDSMNRQHCGILHSESVNNLMRVKVNGY